MADVLKGDGPLKKGAAVPQKFKDWFLNDRDHTEEWRKEAKEDFEFVAGRQYTDQEIALLKKQKRPIVAFNRTAPVIDSVHGQEIGNRREVRYIPRELGDAVANELYTGAAEWFRDQANAETHESDSFRDMLICGMGWTETRLDFEEQPDGKPVVDRIDPFEMYWDFNAKQINLGDSRRRWRVRDVPFSEAKAQFPGFDKDELDAEWTNAQAEDENRPIGDDATDNEADTMVRIVQCQWIEREPYHLAVDPETGEQKEFKPEEFKTLQERMKMLGYPIEGVMMRRRCIKQAFLGEVVLAYGDAPCKDEFSLQCITGKRDRNKGIWYGLVRGMKDPQRWANKWLSQMMHIMNSNSKGGLLAEKGAFENQKQAEESWTDPSAITWLKNGALSGQSPAVKEKPAAQFPAGFQQLTEFAVSSIRDTSGVSVEMLGLREAGQAASLEMQRKQAGMTILQPFFDALKHYRERQGVVMLYYIQHDLSDGRLIKISGPDKEQYLPLLKQATTEYDIIVDDAPTSPNQKEAAWGVMMQLLPVIGQMMPPDMLVTLMEYSPLPSTIVQRLKKQAEEQMAAQSEQAQKQQAIAEEREGAEIEKIGSETYRNTVEAQATAQESQVDIQGLMAEAQLKREEHQFDREKMGIEMAHDQMKFRFDMARMAQQQRIQVAKAQNPGAGSSAR
jgi:hypothetical protein